MATSKRFSARHGLDNNSNTIQNVADPVNAQDAATKAFSSNASNLASGTVNAARLPAFTGDATSTAGTSALTLSNSGVTAGTYKSVTVDVKGRVTAGTNPTTLAGYGITDAQALDADLTAIAGLAGTSGILKKTAANTWSLDTATYLTGNQSITVSGDATGSGTTAITLTLANSGVTAGTYKSVTVDAKGRVTAGTNPTTLSGYGITDAVSSSLIGAASGIVPLGADSKIATTYLPSYVDDVLEYANQAGFPASGETGKIYVALDTNKIYRWSGSVYIEISPTAGNADTATKLAVARTISLSGDATGSVSFDGSANADIAVTIAANSVVLGTDTTGNYVADITAGSYITKTGTAGEGWSPTIAVDAASANTASKVVARDASGNFSANTITAALTGNASTATTLQTARNINGVSFNGSADITVTANTTNSQIIKFDTGTTEGTDLYTFNGSAAKTLDIKAGTNVTLTKTAGSITISANDTSVAWAEITSKPTTLSGYGITDAAPSSHVGATGTAHGTATTSVAGFMSSADKTKLDGIATGANNYVHPTTDGNLHVPATGTTSNGKALIAGSTAGSFAWTTLDLSYLPDAAFKKSVAAATVANITLSGAQTIDGVALVAGDRVLVKDQTTASENGIYIVSASTWARATDADTASKIAGATVNVDSGTNNGGLKFDTDFKTTDTLGTTIMAWSRVVDTGLASAVVGSTPGTAAIGTSLNYARADHVHPLQTSVSGNAGTATTLATGRTIEMTGDVTWTSGSFNGSANVTGTATLANSGVTAGTYTKVTVDAKGRVTTGASLAASDVPSLDAAKITTGTFATSLIPTGISITGNAATATTAGSVATANWTFSQDTDGSLVFKYGGVVKARLSADGSFAAVNVDSDPTP